MASATDASERVPTSLFKARMLGQNNIYVLGTSHFRSIQEEPAILRQELARIAKEKDSRLIVESNDDEDDADENCFCDRAFIEGARYRNNGVRAKLIESYGSEENLEAAEKRFSDQRSVFMPYLDTKKTYDDYAFIPEFHPLAFIYVIAIELLASQCREREMPIDFS